MNIGNRAGSWAKVALALIGVAVAVQAQNPGYDPQPRYRVRYPQGLIVEMSATGESLRSADNAVTGSIQLKQGSGEPKALLAASIAERGTSFQPAYRSFQEDWFVLSGTENGAIIYEKVLVHDKAMQVLSLRYPMSQKSRFDDTVSKLSTSFQRPSRLTAKVSTLTDEMIWLVIDEEFANLHHRCLPTAAETPRFAALREDQVIVVEGRPSLFNVRRATAELSGIYQQRLNECVSLRIVR